MYVYIHCTCTLLGVYTIFDPAVYHPVIVDTVNVLIIDFNFILILCTVYTNHIVSLAERERERDRDREIFTV